MLHCATSSISCYYEYQDYYTNPTKYSYSSTLSNFTTTSVTDAGYVGAIVGGVVGGVVALIVIIGLIFWWKRRNQQFSVTKNGITSSVEFGNGGTTIFMTNNNPQPVYGMNQPMNQSMNPLNPSMNQMNPMNPSMNPSMMNGPNNFAQPFQPSFQPVPQPNFNESFMQAGYGLANPPPQGPIIY